MNTIDLMKAVRVADEDQVEVANIQVRDVVRVWWVAKEGKLEKSSTWGQFLKSLYERFDNKSKVQIYHHISLLIL